MGEAQESVVCESGPLIWDKLSRTVFLALFATGLPTFGEDAVPPSPDRPWSPPGLSEYGTELSNAIMPDASAGSIPIDPHRVYDLPQLIDIAERSNPKTRIAWERARQAAKALGLSESEYYPYLAASAGAVFEQELVVLTSVFPAHVSAEETTLDLKWLLFDFGGRRAAVSASKERLMAANVGFNGVHQQIVFAVTRSFYVYNIARQQVEVAQSALDAARTVGEAAQARLNSGLATKPDVLQASQQTAKAEYDLVAARGDLSDAEVSLVESLGILPTTELHVANVAEKRFDENFSESLDQLIDRALSQRPDLVAKLADLHTAQAGIRKARAEYYPKAFFEASGGWSKIETNAFGDPYFGNSKPDYSAALAIELPIFDGFARRNKLRIAESELRVAQSELTDSRNAAVREVWKAYTDLRTAVRKQESADKLLSAAQSAFDASLEAYRNGLGTYVDVSNAQRNLTAARSTVVDTRSAIFTSSTGLALSVGDLAKPPESPATPQHR